MVAPQELKCWYAQIDDEQLGPLTDRELRSLAASGKLKKDHVVWKSGRQVRVAAEKVRGLFRDMEDKQDGTLDQNPAQPFDVFISYSSDDKLVADAVCAGLENTKIRCWIAPRDVLPGIPYAEAIIEGISNSLLMIVVFSESANSSQQVQREIERGVSKGLPIIPFRIEDVKPSKSMEYFLSAPHWLDALTKPLESHILRLAKVVQAVLNPEKSESASSKKQNTRPTTQSSVETRTSSQPSNWGALAGGRRLFGFWSTLRSTSKSLLLIAFATLFLSTLLLLWGRPNELAEQYRQYKLDLNTGRGSIFFLRTNAPTSFTDWLSLAENQNPIAQLFVGRCYQEGVVVERDYDAANEWLNRSAALGNEYAMATLGYCYGAGMGVEVDTAREMQLYQNAFKKGNPIAAHNIAWLYRQGYGGQPDFKRAIDWFEKSASLDYTPAMSSLGDMYRYGDGVDIDLEKSDKWYERAFNAGNVILVGKRLGNKFATEFATYLASDSTEATKSKAISAINDLQEEYQLQDFPTIAGLFSSSDLNTSKTGLEDLSSDDPLQIAHSELILRYVKLFRDASQSERTANLSGFSLATEQLAKRWYESQSYSELNSFWADCYSDIDFLDLKSTSEWSTFVMQQKWATCSLMLRGKRKEASENITSVLAFCDRVLLEAPWDWYLKDAYSGFCFETAAIWVQLGEPNAAQPLLKRAWDIVLQRFGKEQLLSKYNRLPTKGLVPSGASEEDQEFFESFGPQDEQQKKSSGMKRFTIPCDFAGNKFPFHVYVLKGPRGYVELQDQFRWLEERRGGNIPKEVQDSFRRLNAIAAENNVDFMELCVYALGTAAVSPQEKLDTATSKLADLIKAHSEAKSIESGQSLVSTYAEIGEAYVELENFVAAQRELRNGLRVLIEIAKSFPDNEWAANESKRLRERITEIGERIK